MAKTFPLSPWPQGLDNIAPETELPKDTVRIADNVDFTAAGKARRREGYVIIYSLPAHSLFACYWITLFVEGASLKQLHSDNSATTLVSGLTPKAFMSYEHVNGEIFYTNGHQMGRIVYPHTPCVWGVETPPGDPVQVDDTFLASTAKVDGVESGIGAPGGNGTIYKSLPGGDILYRNGDAVHAALPLSVRNPFPGQIVRYYRGRLYIAKDNVLWFSLPFNYHLIDATATSILFSSRITLLEPVEDGIFLASDQTYFISGMGPEEFKISSVFQTGAIEGMSLSIDAHDLDLKDFPDKSGQLAVWFSEDGFIAGLPGGKAIPISHDRVAVHDHERGAMLLRDVDGIRSLVASLMYPKSGTDALVSSDKFTAEVRRNGVLI